MNGKGDSPRPLSVTQNKFSDNWELIFGKKEICEYSGLLPVSGYDSPQHEKTNIPFKEIDNETSERSNTNAAE